jgi:hypothetical protein
VVHVQLLERHLVRQPRPGVAPRGVLVGAVCVLGRLGHRQTEGRRERRRAEDLGADV